MRHGWIIVSYCIRVSRFHRQACSEERRLAAMRLSSGSSLSSFDSSIHVVGRKTRPQRAGLGSSFASLLLASRIPVGWLASRADPAACALIVLAAPSFLFYRRTDSTYLIAATALASPQLFPERYNL